MRVRQDEQAAITEPPNYVLRVRSPLIGLSRSLLQLQ